MRSLPTTDDAPVLLVVDDDDDVRLALRLFLEGEGFTIDEAPNGLEALKLLEEGLRPQAIVLDLMMPVMNGFEFRARQRANPELKDIPVVVFTAAGVRIIEDVIVLPKPVDTMRLLDALSATKKAGTTLAR